MEPKLVLDGLIQMAMTGEARDYRKAIRGLESLKEGLSDEQAQKLDEDFQDGVVDALGNAAGGVTDDIQKAIKGAVASNMTLGALKAGAGLFQVIDASLKKKNLDAPDFPQLLAKNSKLQNRIADAQVRAEQGDPAIRGQFERDMAMLDAVTNERNKAAGNIGQYTSNVQGNALRRSREAGRFAAEEANRRSRYRSELDDLIGQDIREDRYRQGEKWRQFNVRENRYTTSLANLNNQSNSGVENIFTGLDQLAEGARDLPFLSAPKTEPMADDLWPIDHAQPMPEPDPLDLGTVTRLGSPSFRQNNPQTVADFQQFIGLPNTGVWNEETMGMYDDITTF